MSSKLIFQNCCTTRRIQRVDAGLKKPDFDFVCVCMCVCVCFFFNTFVTAYRIILQSFELLPIVSFLFSAITSHPSSVESAILINLFLFLLICSRLTTLKLDSLNFLRFFVSWFLVFVFSNFISNCLEP